MKKFYTLALAAAVTLSASAAVKIDQPQANLTLNEAIAAKTFKTKELTPRKSVMNKVPMINNSKLLNTKSTTVRKAASEVKVYDGYVWNFTTYGQSDQLQDVTNQMFYISPSEEEGEAIISFIGLEAPVVCDLNTATLSIVPYLIYENEPIGNANYDLYIFPVKVGETDWEIVEQIDLKVTEDGIEISEDDGWEVDAVPAGMSLQQAAQTNNIYGYTLCLFNEFKRYVESDYWTNIGVAKYADGIFYSLYRDNKEGDDSEVMVSDVEVQRSVQNPNVLRIKNPFGPYMSQFYESGHFVSEPLLVDITDPDAVYVPIQESGVLEPELGSLAVMTASAAFTDFRDFPQELFDQWGGTYATYSNNVINFPQGSIWIYLPDVTSGGNVITKLPEFKTYIELPEGWDAIDNVAVEGADAPVEYFNLQGVRVANPENGLYIRRCGKNVKKVLVK